MLYFTNENNTFRFSKKNLSFCVYCKTLFISNDIYKNKCLKCFNKLATLKPNDLKKTLQTKLK